MSPRLSEREATELAARFDEVWQLKRADSPYLRDGIEAFIEFWERLEVRRFERERELDGYAVRLLRWRPGA